MPPTPSDDPHAPGPGARPSRREQLRARWPASRRRQVATVVALVAIFVATAIASSKLLQVVFADLDIVAYVGLFAACWIGAGGALVPIPGVRPISWFMVIQQGAALDPVTVALVAALAMVLGQSSYFVAARRVARRVAEHGAAASTSAAIGAPEAAAAGPRGPVDAGLDVDPGTEAGTLTDADLALEESALELSTDSPPVPGRLTRAKAGVERRVRTHAMATVFVVSALPSPLTTLTTSAAAATGMPYARFFPASFAGFLVLCSILALFGQGLLAALRSMA